MRDIPRFLPEVSLVSNNSRGTTFPEHLQRPFAALRQRLARWNFHTLGKPETKRSLQDFGGFGRRLREAEGEEGGRQCLAILTRIVLSLLSSPLPPASPPLSLSRSLHTSVDSARRDLGEILEGFREQRVQMPRTLYPRVFSYAMSLPPLAFLSLPPQLVPLSLSLSFNLRLDCRLHIVLSLLLPSYS